MNSPPYNLIVSSGFVTIDLKKEYEDRIDARYLFLLLTQPAITEYIACIADSAVSAYPSFNPSDISEIAFSFPNIEKQKAISEIWSNFEQKISINRQINDNLRASRAQSQTQFELCRGAAVNADVSPNLPMLDRSLKEAATRLAV